MTAAQAEATAAQARQRGVFRAIWPIVDEKAIGPDLISDAERDLPAVAARHGARILGRPRFTFEPGWRTPGSGNLTRLVLVAEAPAEGVRRG